jgi:hypothetical protein
MHCVSGRGRGCGVPARRRGRGASLQRMGGGAERSEHASCKEERVWGAERRRCRAGSQVCRKTRGRGRVARVVSKVMINDSAGGLTSRAASRQQQADDPGGDRPFDFVVFAGTAESFFQNRFIPTVY